MARRGKGVYRRGGPYQFTARRRYALKKAQEASAKKRKAQRNKRIGVAAGAIAGIAVAGYMGKRYGSAAIQSSVKNKRAEYFKTHREHGKKMAHLRKVAQPGSKEATRIANALMNSRPSATTTQGPITDADRQRAANTRARMAQQALPPHMGGPDRRIYTDDDEVNTTAMTNRGVRRSLKKAKAKTTGTKAASLTGTPGGTLTPPKAIKGNPKWTDEQWADAMAFDTPVNQPISGGSSRKSSAPTRRDPLHTLAKMRYDDAKLLGSGAPGAGDTDAFLRSAGTSRPAPAKRSIKRAKR